MTGPTTGPTTDPVTVARAGATSGRRSLTVAVLLCAVGAALAWYAATRTWVVEVTVRPAPLPELRAARTGGDVLPWLPALAVVALAGAGALIATRGVVRRAVGGLLAVLGAAVAGGGAYGLVAVHAGGWPVPAALGGLAVLVAGGWAAARSADWPAMGARYERTAPPAGEEPVPAGLNGPRGTRQAWDALDRGEDPTDD